MVDQEDILERHAANTDSPAPADLPEDISPQADDADADADVARPSRVMQYRVRRRTQFSMMLPALGLLLLGILFLAQTLTPEVTLVTPLGAVAASAGAVAVGLLYRFLVNGRREVGVLLLSLVLLLWLALGAAFAVGVLDVLQGWPLAVSAVGVAILAMSLFVRERGLLLPGLAIIVMGVTALMFTTQTVPLDSVSPLAQSWPVLLVLVGLLFLPGALRNR
jgi:hypothetical protein